MITLPEAKTVQHRRRVVLPRGAAERLEAGQRCIICRQRLLVGVVRRSAASASTWSPCAAVMASPGADHWVLRALRRKTEHT
jgi:hypothetical protein